MSGFTRLIIKTKYVCHGPVNPHASFLVNRLVKTVILLVKKCRWGGEEPFLLFQLLQSAFFQKKSPKIALLAEPKFFDACESCTRVIFHSF